MPDFVIPSLRGGLNEDPPTSLADDQCTVALNVEFWASMLGERRLGGASLLSLIGSPLAGCDRVVWMHRHLPTINPTEAQYWAIGLTGVVPTLVYKDTAWHTVTMPDAMVVDGVSEYQVQGQSFNGKLFLAYRSAIDRLHVWETGLTALRRTGLAQAGALTSANEFGTGTFTGTRYYRPRFVTLAGSTVKRRSEAGPVHTASPSGGSQGIRLGSPVAIGEGETHWELEASVDNANFYRIGRAAVGTTIDDTQVYARGYAQDFPLSETTGNYENLPSVKLLTVEQDRLMGANFWNQPTDASTVIWTPVLNDPGDGNDERLPVESVNVLGLDANDGGQLTNLSATINGYVYATKLSHTYQLTRSGLRAHAYEAVPLTKQRGAIFGSLIEALDQTGNPSPFALDPDIGPWRIGPRGVEPCGADLRRTWETVNLDATQVAARGLYFPEKKQVHWWIATGVANTPNLRLALHTQEMRAAKDGLRGGWALWNGGSATAIACCLFADNIDSNGPRSNVLVPFIGLVGNGLIWRTDQTDNDNGTAYHAAIRSKPFVHGSLMHQFECHSAMLLAGAVPGGVLDVVLRADFGLVETRVSGVRLDPVATEQRVIKNLDDLGLAELRSLQVTFEDSLTVASTTATGTTQWSLEQFAMREVGGARA